MSTFPYIVQINPVILSTPNTSDNSATNIRTTETATAIRNNQYNPYTGVFNIKPVDSNVTLNSPQISSIYFAPNKFYKFDNDTTEI
jgi:hypothetical protein